MKITGRDYRSGKSIQLTITDGKIENIQEINKPDNTTFIAPGLVDLQINGIIGIDFNSIDLTIQDIEKVTLYLLKKGVCTYYPTLITNSVNVLSKILGIFTEACIQNELIEQCIGGIHLEGPFISEKGGARGAHDQKFILDPDINILKELQAISYNRIKIITLAPEKKGAAAFIKYCTQHNIIASIGHSYASPKDIDMAIEAGATMSTHLGNAVPLLLPRHPNLIWEQMAAEQLSAGFIADGFHLPDSFMKVLIKTKNENAFLVSDATSFAGMPAGNYHTHIGGNVTLSKEGRLYLSDNPKLLAGASKLLPYAIEHLLQNKICNLPEAWNMGSVNAAKAVGLNTCGIAKNNLADLVLFEISNKCIVIKQVIKNGKKQHKL